MILPGQSKWSDEDQRAALEWQDWQASLCSGCRHPRAESFGEDGPEYEAVALRCYACEARDRLVKKWQEDENARREGVYFVPKEVSED